MSTDGFSTIKVAPHPATHLQASLPKKKSYLPPSMRKGEDQVEPTFDGKNFPSLSNIVVAKDSANLCSPSLNYLSKIKEAEARREEESFYDPEKIASMTVRQLVREGWLIINRDGTFIEETAASASPIEHSITTPPYDSKPAFPFHPDPTRRRILVKKPSYTDLYDIDYDEYDGAVVPMIDEEDDESSV